MSAKQQRSRNGCLTCRSRHLKCDEMIPECLNCKRSNKTCERGIRIKMIQTTRFDVKKNDFNYRPRGQYQFLDQSLAVASDYIGGDVGYKPYIKLHTPEDLRESLDQYNLSTDAPPAKKAKIYETATTVNMSLVNQIESALKDRDEKSYISALVDKEESSSAMGGSSTSLDSPLNLTSRDSPLYNSSSTQSEGKSPQLTPSKNRAEALLLANFVHHCTWILDFVCNGNVVPHYVRLWEDEIMPNMVVRDEDLLRCIFRCSLSFPPQKWHGLIPVPRQIKTALPLHMRVEPSKEKLDFYAKQTDAYQSRLFEEIRQDPFFQDPQNALPDEISRIKTKLEKYMISATLVCLSIYFEDLTRQNMVSAGYLQAQMKSVSSLILESKILGSAIFADSRIFESCFTMLFTIDLWGAIMHKQPSVLDPFEVGYLLPLLAESDTNSDLAPNKSSDTFEQARIEELTNAATESDTIQLSRILIIMSKIYRCGQSDLQNMDEKWIQLIEEINTFEKELPFVYAPSGLSKVTADDGLGTAMTEKESGTPESRASEVFKAPFMKIQFSSTAGLVVHLLHHAAYLMSEKVKLPTWPSFFPDNDNEDWNFRLINWYNLNTTFKHSEDSPTEREHMAIRVISMLLSVEIKSNRLHMNGSQTGKGQIIYPHFKWLYDLSLTFLSQKSLNALDDMLNDLRGQSQTT
ncbi:unnamed protein product [Kuraishia capsulata CBS 1993]|uniref:Zn(2)-C6 fungal-type domain-containing protein n=1 Tax=Kuraishia capsulata CBS 1993 TaxID=1382522 RepID=W6MWC0_9ASCO|nr:uncharacterized protein KUCA_T00003157001 [Kuraishia capsulata CBS 1993]CDK27180.1 unnamed protein product [Kuraishia capsulata CBS 1993]